MTKLLTKIQIITDNLFTIAPHILTRLSSVSSHKLGEGVNGQGGSVCIKLIDNSQV